ncbi:MAG TPA: ABC transporter ATP-binding protein [Acidimicrobiales bacterium]|nr:ABC transporter ATP-binding protein [Acidimicrobiales bacterium]
MPEEPILDVDGVDFSYGPLQILFDISLSLARGEALALLGTNGAGKSTLLKAVSGLLAPQRGSIRLNGEPISGRGAEEVVRRGLVLVRGGQGVFPDMTVSENLDLHALTLRRRRDVAARRRARILELFPRLAQRANAKAGSMSGGEQQQLALAKAVMLEPSVLCIDELSLGLAPIVVQELLSIVREIQAAGTSIVLVEQSLNIASELCERAVFMEKGQIRFEGATRELLDRDDIARAVFLGA